MNISRSVNLPGLASFAIVVVLAGCGSAQPATQAIYVPTYVSCVKEVPMRPDYAVERLAPDATDGSKVLAFVGDWPRGRKYEGELEAAVAGCR